MIPSQLLRLLSILFLLLLNGRLGAQGTSTTAADPGLTAPPGTLAYGMNAFVDEKWITNLDYREYLFFQAREKRDIRPLLPDTGLFMRLPFHNIYQKKWLLSNYFGSSDCADLPVVGLTHSQQMAYAAWRSAVVTQYRRTRAGQPSCRSTKHCKDIVPYMPAGYDSIAYAPAACSELAAARTAGLKLAECKYSVFGGKKPRAYDYKPESENVNANLYQLSYAEKCQDDARSTEHPTVDQLAFTTFRCTARYMPPR